MEEAKCIWCGDTGQKASDDGTKSVVNCDCAKGKERQAQFDEIFARIPYRPASRVIEQEDGMLLAKGLINYED